MSEEEKELIKEFKEELNKDLKDKENVNDTFLMVTMHNIEIIVNLIEKQENIINKAINYICNTHIFYGGRVYGKTLFGKYINDVLKILKGE